MYIIKNKKIKNCIIIIILLILFTISLMLILKKQHNSILLSVIPEIKYVELNNYILDNNDCLIYIGNNNIDKAFELELKEYIINNNIDIIYMYVNESELIKLKKDYSIDDIYIPNILLFDDKNIKDILYTNKSELKIEDVIIFLQENGVIK